MSAQILSEFENPSSEEGCASTAVAVAESQHAYAPMSDLERALMAEQELSAAQQQITWLGESNVRLRQQIVSLAHLEDQARHDAYHDELTCLPNRRLLLDRLNQALGQAVRQRKQVVLLLLDLDGFKAVNDRLGHAGGDKLLREVAERLVACIRGADTACRYGGDEFVVMLPEIDGAEHCANVVNKIRSLLAPPYVIDRVEITLTMSIGTAVFPVDAKSRSELLKHADMQMYRAKSGGETYIRWCDVRLTEAQRKQTTKR